MTELSFLIELLLNHELPKDTKSLIASRIKEVEEQFNSKSAVRNPQVAQAQVPISIAQTPEAQAALARRQEVMRQALSDKPEKGSTQPRKW